VGPEGRPILEQVRSEGRSGLAVQNRARNTVSRQPP
jgi:hypothetical protein